MNGLKMSFEIRRTAAQQLCTRLLPTHIIAEEHN